jgi:HEPN domain-containing protein
MGFARDKFKDFAIAFWKTAWQDLVRAEDAYKEGAYSYAVFHAQQSAEKAVKGIMEMEEVFVRDHDISDVFTIFILKPEKESDVKDQLYKIFDILEWFKGKWNITRYPFIREGKVVSPFEAFGEKDAGEALEKARFVFESITMLMRTKYGLELE